MIREGWRNRRRHDLTEEERILWEKIVETVRPLAGRRSSKLQPKVEPDPVAAKPAVPKPPNPRPHSAPKKILSAKPAPVPLAALEPKLARDLRRGGAVDARIDLHGMRQEEAHVRLRGFLRSEQARGARIVLVITGKGRTDRDRGALFEERGVLRRLVPAWLAEPDLRSVVIGFSEASPPHGGAGALYVRIRRER